MGRISGQVSKLFFEMIVQVHFLLGQTEGEEKSLCWTVQERGHPREITPKSTLL